MTILVVDDEADIQLLFEQRFRKERREGLFEMHFAQSGKAALEYLQNQGTVGLVLILADINMPGMNGLELLRQVKESYPHLPVFMITAYGDDDNYRKALELGSNDYLTKPIDFEELKGKIRNICQTSQPRIDTDGR